MADRYIGPDKVVMVSECEHKTPMGADMVLIHFEGNTAPETMPKATFERLVTPEPMEPTLFREKRYEPLLNDLTAVMMEYDVKFGDLAYVGKSLVNKIEDAFERASSFLWTGDDRRWTSGIDHRHDLTLLGAEKVLREIKQDEPKPKDNA